MTIGWPRVNNYMQFLNLLPEGVKQKKLYNLHNSINLENSENSMVAGPHLSFSGWIRILVFQLVEFLGGRV